MSDLLTEAVEAHGGLERWKKFGVLEASLSVGGGIWHFKQQPGLFDKVLFEIDLQQERVTVDSFAGNARLSFTPDRLRLETLDGTPIESRDNPAMPSQDMLGIRRGTGCTPVISAAMRSGPT